MAIIMVNGRAIGGKETISKTEGNIIKREENGSLYASIELETEDIDFSDFFNLEEGDLNNG